MLFNSIEFIIFIFFLIPIYYSLASKSRWIVLLAGSYFFYAFWNFAFFPFLIISTLVDYIAAIKIEKESNLKKRRLFLIFSISINIGFLIYFKYYIFLWNALLKVFPILPQLPAETSLLLPVGISFYTFQTMGYTLDVYWKRRTPEKNLGKFALFVSYFPQLISGPIENSRKLIPQFTCNKKLNYDQYLDGIVLIIWGFLKKVVIADNLLPIYKQIYGNIEAYSPESVIFATVLMTFVYYFDFSGYCDIAIGTSRLFGIKLTRNFNLPYISKSMGEVWKRWHITLSDWIRDYLSFYLSRRSFLKNKKVIVLLISFSLLGLWHGSNWNFFFFGFFHGVFVLIDKYASKLVSPFFPKLTNKLYTFSIHTLKVFKIFIIWNLVGVFLIAKDLSEAIRVFKHVFYSGSYSIYEKSFNLISILNDENIALRINNFNLIVVLATVVIMVEILFEGRKIQKSFIKWTWITILLGIIFSYGSFKEIEFLYFKF